MIQTTFWPNLVHLSYIYTEINAFIQTQITKGTSLNNNIEILWDMPCATYLTYICTKLVYSLWATYKVCRVFKASEDSAECAEGNSWFMGMRGCFTSGSTYRQTNVQQ